MTVAIENNNAVAYAVGSARTAAHFDHHQMQKIKSPSQEQADLFLSLVRKSKKTENPGEKSSSRQDCDAQKEEYQTEKKEQIEGEGPALLNQAYLQHFISLSAQTTQKTVAEINAYRAAEQVSLITALNPVNSTQQLSIENAANVFLKMMNNSDVLAKQQEVQIKLLKCAYHPLEGTMLQIVQKNQNLDLVVFDGPKHIIPFLDKYKKEIRDQLVNRLQKAAGMVSFSVDQNIKLLMTPSEASERNS